MNMYVGKKRGNVSVANDGMTFDCQFDGNFLLIAPTSYVSGYYTSRFVLLRAVYRG